MHRIAAYLSHLKMQCSFFRALHILLRVIKGIRSIFLVSSKCAKFKINHVISLLTEMNYLVNSAVLLSVQRLLCALA